MGYGSRHNLRDRGCCRQFCGHRGGQRDESACGEGVEVFSINYGVDPAALFYQVFFGLQDHEGSVERHGDSLGGVNGVAKFAENQHVAALDFDSLYGLFDREYLVLGVAQDPAVGVGVGNLQQAIEGRGGLVSLAHEADHLEFDHAPFRGS